MSFEEWKGPLGRKPQGSGRAVLRQQTRLGSTRVEERAQRIIARLAPCVAWQRPDETQMPRERDSIHDCCEPSPHRQGKGALARAIDRAHPSSLGTATTPIVSRSPSIATTRDSCRSLKSSSASSIAVSEMRRSSILITRSPRPSSSNPPGRARTRSATVSHSPLA